MDPQADTRFETRPFSAPAPAPAGAAEHGPVTAPEPATAPEAPRADPGGGGPDRETLLKRVGGPLAAIALLIAKFAAKAKALLLILPKIKLFTTSASALVSIGAYALIWGWRFGVGFVAMLFIHEMGHVLQLRREGIKATAPMFIPFLGAVVGMKELPKDAAAEARVGLAGPVLGALAAVVPFVIWLVTGNEFWQALAYVGFFLNLFNLLPVLPLDGGRAMAALSPWVWFVGYTALVALAFVFPNPIFLLILIVGGFETWRRFKSRNSPEAQAFHDVPTRTRIAVAAVYLGLAALLAVGMSETFLERSFDDV